MVEYSPKVGASLLGAFSAWIPLPRYSSVQILHLQIIASLSWSSYLLFLQILPRVRCHFPPPWVPQSSDSGAPPSGILNLDDLPPGIPLIQLLLL